MTTPPAGGPDTLTALGLCALLGPLGIHRTYLGQAGAGVFPLLAVCGILSCGATWVPMMGLWIADMVTIGVRLAKECRPQ